MIFNRRLTVDEIRTWSRAAAVAKDFAAGSVLKAGMPVDIDFAHHVEARSTATFDGSAISPDFGTWSRIGSVLTYTPTDTGLDTDNYTYTVDDGDLGSDGGTITIEAVDEAPAPEDNYATEAMGIANLLAYWRLADASAGALADASGNGHNGSYNGSPMFRVGDLTEAWQASDGFAVNLAGNGHGIVSHNAAFAPARGSLGFWFRVNSLTGSPELITKGSNFRIRVTSSGAFECLIGSMTLATIAGVIGAGGVTIAPSSRCRLFGEHSRLTRIRRVTRDDQNGIEVESGSHFSRVDHCFVGISTRRPNRPAAMPGCGCGSRARTLRTTHGTRWSTIAT